MTTKSEKPYVLRAAEFVYSNIIEIKKQNPEINNIQAFEIFMTTKEYDILSSGEFHDKWFLELKNNKFIELDRLTNSLGNSKRKWVRSINKNIKNDRDLGLALLFSKKAPEIKTILNTRKLILENDNCPKY